MHRRSEKRQHKSKLIAAILVMALIITAAIPINAMNESQEAIEQPGMEQPSKAEEAVPEGSEVINEQTDNANTENDLSGNETDSDMNKNIDNPSGEDTERVETAQEEENGEDIIAEPENEDAETENAEVVNSEEINEADEQFTDGNLAVMAADTSDLVTAPDLVGNVDKANEWQIVAEEYTGREQNDKKGYDLDKDGNDDIFYQKNVIPTGVENEFRVYMGISKRMTWDELLAESEFAITTANNWHKIAIGTRTESINGKYSTISPGTVSDGRNYEAVVNYMRNGKVVHTYKGWYHGNTPNCANGTGFIWLKSLKTYLVASHSVNLGNGGNQLTYTIDLDEMTKQNVHFSLDDIVADSVQDTMGDYITYEGIENCDGTNNYDENTRTLTWIPASNGASGVEVVQGSGLTGYHYNIHQLVYKAHLKVEQDGFHSCAQNMNSKVGDQESYQVNQKAVLNCHMGSYTGVPEFQIPYVRGLLYDLEFQKVIKDSKISLANVKFNITRQQSGSTIAEQLSRSDQGTTDSDGWIKFHNLPWGVYTLQELAGEENSFQNDYLDKGELSKTYTIQIGKVINESALSQDHDSGHSVDLPSDIKNMLVRYNGNGIFENTPNTARVTIKKVVNEYDSISSELKDQSYSIKTESSGEKDIYLKQKQEDTTLNRLTGNEQQLKHEESVTYDLIVPENGGVLSVDEIIPEALRDKIVFDSVSVEKSRISTETGNVTTEDQGCKLAVLPGNDLTVTITNIPVGKVRIQKIIDNYQTELAEDAFIIRAESSDDGGQAVNAETVLKHQEISGTITVRKSVTLNIEEILPKEYSMSQITLSGGGTLNGNQVTVNPGEDVVIIVHNTYSGKPFFHASDTIRNIFKWK